MITEQQAACIISAMNALLVEPWVKTVSVKYESDSITAEATSVAGLTCSRRMSLQMIDACTIPSSFGEMHAKQIIEEHEAFGSQRRLQW